MKEGDVVNVASVDSKVVEDMKSESKIVVARVYSWKWMKVALSNGAAYVRQSEFKEA